MADGTNGADSTSDVYRGISARLGLTDKAQRGSGILTAVAAVALAAAAADAHDAAVVAANAIGTDTDTIGTMAGALLGACDTATEPPEKPLDSDYLLREADRLVSISQGGTTAGHSYPDILIWIAPQAQADALVQADDRLVVEGLGAVTELAADISWTSGKDFAWQWVRTEFGQTLLVKRRSELRSSSVGNALVSPSVARTSSPSDPGAMFPTDTTDRSRAEPLSSADLQSAINFARKWINHDDAIGCTVRRVAEQGTVDDLVALVTAIRDDLRS